MINPVHLRKNVSTSSSTIFVISLHVKVSFPREDHQFFDRLLQHYHITQSENRDSSFDIHYLESCQRISVDVLQFYMIYFFLYNLRHLWISESPSLLSSLSILFIQIESDRILNELRESIYDIDVAHNRTDHFHDRISISQRHSIDDDYRKKISWIQEFPTTYHVFELVLK